MQGLRRHRTQQKEARLRLGSAYEDQGLVCATREGRPIRPRHLTKALKRFAASLDLPVRFLDLRHTHLSHLLAQGVHPKIASERAGHASIAITLDVYSHVMPGLQKDAAARVDAALQAELQR